ncbi:MAG TPA: ABC transporter permease subunit, partial [Fimbriiglobus sp.]|nr:ABC transporter permease subunit [Fimbriiglobus sp.]
MLGPIFMRELATVPRRTSHFASRAALLGLIVVLGATAWQATVGFTREATLGEAARFGLLLFQIVVFVQLLLLIFFAALSAASAVAQEKDRRTFVLLLITDMRDYEIVLGKLLGALLPITVLLLVSVPALALMLLMGGIGPSQVVQATAVMLTTAFAAGSLGGLVALWRERTFQALALSVLFLALYLSLTQAVGAVGPAVTPAVDWGLVQACIDPFRAMLSVLDPPPGGWAALPPAYGFSLVMLGWCVLLNGIGIARLRRWNPSGEPVMQREGPTEDPEANLAPEELKAFRSKAHAAPGTVRQVWENPVLWREVRTLAYGRRPLLVKLAFGVVLALVLYYAVEMLYQPGGRPAFAAAYGLVPVAVLSLLLVAAQAVTSVTSERDTGALDVLLVTDISPYEFVFGKLLGVVYNTKEYLLPPLALAVYYAVEGLYAKSPPGAGWWDRFLGNFGPMLTVLGALVVLFAFVLVLGLHVALRLTNSRL